MNIFGKYLNVMVILLRFSFPLKGISWAKYLNLMQDTGSGQYFNHVQVFMDNEILVIKINLGEMLGLFNSDSSKDTIFSSGKELFGERSKAYLFLESNNSQTVQTDPSLRKMENSYQVPLSPWKIRT